jgi:hypothetical protein
VSWSETVWKAEVTLKYLHVYKRKSKMINMNCKCLNKIGIETTCLVKLKKFQSVKSKMVIKYFKIIKPEVGLYEDEGFRETFRNTVSLNNVRVRSQ